MTLDIISILPQQQQFETPLLFVHGAWHANWCWQETFMPFFVERGFAVHALSLRGHGESSSQKSIKRLRGSDYVADVETAVSQLPTRPILIGHSMGGYVVQKYLETFYAPGAVLLASVPVHGVWRITMKIAKNHPQLFAKLNLKQSLYEVVSTPELAREHLYTPNTPEAIVKKTFAKLQEESYFAFLDMLLFDLPRPDFVNTPMLVLGGEQDYIFATNEVEKTAVAYKTHPHFFPMGHNMMLESGWEAVAEKIAGWIGTLSLL